MKWLTRRALNYKFVYIRDAPDVAVDVKEELRPKAGRLHISAAVIKKVARF